MENQYEFSRKVCEDFLADGDSFDLVSCVDAEEIQKEIKNYNGSFSEGYCENICLYRNIAEQIPALDRFVFHGAAISILGKGFIFTAPSGTGKTTHISLLMKRFGESVKIINGDKPIIKVNDDGAVVYSTPWAGKEGWKTNSQAPLSGIVILKRGKENKITKIRPSEYFEELVNQIYIPKNGEMLLKTLDLLDKLSQKIDFYLLECDISAEAAETSYKMLSSGL